ncbi:ABC transporter ATP-binding protein [Pseudoalteromonas sp. T1lg76]|uniref:ABC transporter ATP-binding protein n=1 Tax=Pseudoalteromonas sp. T1lg76 TaxID=2077103 RepID=UPI001F1BF4B7|nr:ABC transporter ATP-binding protein [Pseudoalteromonas sp. T1lg76]
MSHHSLLTVEQLQCRLQERQVLDGISFSLQQGEFIGLLGPNGAGKSSLLRCIYRYYSSAVNAVRLDGRCIQGMAPRALAQDMAVVLQQAPSDMSLTVVDVVALGLLPGMALWQRPDSEALARVQQAIADVGLAAQQHKQLAQLSGGEQQRVHIARALVQRPKLLIMDEPTSHLDIKYQIELMELVRSLNLTVLASFHDLNLAAAMCDKLLVLDGGKLVANGTPKAVITESLLSEVFGVCTQVGVHPQNPEHWPLVHYFYADRSQKS